MGRAEVACRRFAVLSGIQQEPDNYATCVLPKGALGLRRGLLAVVTEPAGDHPALATEASRLVHRALVQQYYADNSVTLTSGLLRAFDTANSTILQYNYHDDPPGSAWSPQTEHPIAVQGGGVRTRRSQVGLTAILLRPDGEGIYLGQMDPTQAYIWHNGSLTALPEPPSWHERPGKPVAVPRQISGFLEDDMPEVEELTLAEDPPSVGPPVPLPASPMGSGPTVEVDLLYRRVDHGDVVAVVSSSISRHLDRALAEEIFSTGDPDAIIEALHELAMENALAEAHACVLQIGAEVTSGVDTDITSPVNASNAHTYVESGGSSSAPVNGNQAQHPNLAGALNGPRNWFVKLKTPGASEDTFSEPDAMPANENEHDAEPIQHPQYPTAVLLQRTPEIPPFKAANGIHSEQSEKPGELEFDGWEDVPPALGQAADQSSWVNALSSREHLARHRAAGTNEDHEPAHLSTSQYATHRPRVYPVPTLFDGEDAEWEQEAIYPDAAPPIGTRAVKWSRSLVASLLPDREQGEAATIGSRRLPSMVYLRMLIVVGLVLVAAVLALSVYSIGRNSKASATNTYLKDAQQEDLLSNQPNLTQIERQQHLALALDKAKQALQSDPQSKEAALLIEKTGSALDSLQGITRVEPKLLFDLDNSDNTSATAISATSPGSTAQAPAAAPVSDTAQLGGMAMLSNDAYVLDKDKGRIYKCRIATHDCAAVLQTGDSAGGQKVGALLGMTLRVGSLVAVDDKLVSFIYSADTSSWQAQPLGGTNGFDKPKDIASYDGNLYLLAAQPGQIAKYVSGRYGENPDNWIKDPASVDQMKNPISFGIDGSIFVLLADGKVLVMEGGKVVRTIVPKPGGDGTSAPTELFTNTDIQDLYLFNQSAGTVTRLTKEGQTRATFKAKADSGLNTVSGMTVDEGRGKIYLLSGRKVYEASMVTVRSITPTDQPSARPTAVP